VTRDATTPRWLLLIHQIPPKPAYARVKIGRHLARLGAVPIKNTVYALPLSATAQEDFAWVAREVMSLKGEATLCEARLVEGLSDDDVRALFRRARDADYAALAGEVDAAARTAKKRPSAADTAALVASVARLRQRLSDVTAIDFFDAPGRAIVVAKLESLERRGRGEPPPDAPQPLSVDAYRGRTWVTRTGLFVDRIASAWLIRRFIDPDARFRWVKPEYRAKRGEVAFDMFEAEFTHEGDACTFEVLVARFALSEPGLRPLAEIVHDLDLKDGKYGRPETSGVGRTLVGLATVHRGDDARIAHGSDLFEALLAGFRREEM
jgi:hypothetical protein